MVRECETCRHYSFKVWGIDRSISGKCFGWEETRYVESENLCDKWENIVVDDLFERLRKVGGVRHDGATRWYVNPDGPEAADRIEQLEEENKRLCANAISDAKWLGAYHHWCRMNGCAPSSADLSVARVELAGEKKDER